MMLTGSQGYTEWTAARSTCTRAKASAPPRAERPVAASTSYREGHRPKRERHLRGDDLTWSRVKGLSR